MTDTNRECALWLASIDRTLFEQAVSALNTRNRLGGKSWDEYRITLPDYSAPELNLDPQNIKAFERLTRDALKTSKSSLARGRIKAVPFRRLQSTEVTHTQRTVTQVTFYAESPHESSDRLSEANEVDTEIIRPIVSGAAIFDGKLRTIEVVVLGGAQVRRAVADAFCKTFVSDDAELTRLISQNIDFSRFSQEPVLPLNVDDPVEHVAVDEIRYSLPDSSNALITFEKPYSAKDRTSVYADARDWPEVTSPEDMHSWKIVTVRLRFLFKETGGIKQRIRTVELKSPNRTNLREKSDTDHATMYRLLERWSIFKADQSGADNDA